MRDKEQDEDFEDESCGRDSATDKDSQDGGPFRCFCVGCLSWLCHRGRSQKLP
jgi:hypothetical protein